MNHKFCEKGRACGDVWCDYLKGAERTGFSKREVMLCRERGSGAIDCLEGAISWSWTNGLFLQEERSVPPSPTDRRYPTHARMRMHVHAKYILYSLGGSIKYV